MDLFTDKADLSGITGQPQHRISQVSYPAFLFNGPMVTDTCITFCTAIHGAKLT